MSGWVRWKMALYLAGIFLAGGVSGWVVGSRMERQKASKPPQPQEIATSFRDRLHAHLSLTEDQAKQIDRIIERSSGEMSAIRDENLKCLKQARSSRNAQIAALLTSEQQKQFEQIEKERKEMGAKDSWRGKHGKEGKDGREGRRGTREKGATNNPAAGPSLPASR